LPTGPPSGLKAAGGRGSVDQRGILLVRGGVRLVRVAIRRGLPLGHRPDHRVGAHGDPPGYRPDRASSAIVGISSEVCPVLGREPSEGTEISRGSRKCDSRPSRTRNGGATRSAVGAELPERRERQPIDRSSSAASTCPTTGRTREQKETSQHEVTAGSVLLTTQGRLTSRRRARRTHSPDFGGSAPDSPTRPAPLDEGWASPVRTVITTPRYQPPPCVTTLLPDHSFGNGPAPTGSPPDPGVSPFHGRRSRTPPPLKIGTIRTRPRSRGRRRIVRGNRPCGSACPGPWRGARSPAEAAIAAGVLDPRLLRSL
jgi:hypothetical protein